MEFKGKVAVITGGAMGIGRATAGLLVQEGAKVVLADQNRTEGAAAAAEMSQAGPGEAVFFLVNLERPEEIRALIQETFKSQGRIDHLVNNAGICPLSAPEEISLEEWDRVLNINLRAVFLACQAVMPIMARQGSGAMVNLSSIAGKTGGAAVGAHYSASKAGVISLTKSFARALASSGVRVNAVAPGPVESPMTRAMTEKARQTMTANSPLEGMAQPEDVAQAVVFLLSDRARRITGEILDVNGGLLMD